MRAEDAEASRRCWRRRGSGGVNVIEEDEDGDSRGDKVFIEALRDIKAGEELTYNYGITLAERHTAKLKEIWECRCGSPKCTGTMLQPKR